MRDNLFSGFNVPVRELKRTDLILSQIIESLGPCRLGHGDQGFTALVRSMIGQQLSKSAAQSIYQRLSSLCGDKGITPKLLYSKSELELRNVGLSRSKAECLKGLAGLVLSGQIEFQELETMDDETVISILTQVKGIGQWTAEMYLIFSLGRLDVFPFTDASVRRAMMKVYKLDEQSYKKQAERIANKWRPYRTIACWYLYRYIDLIRNNSSTNIR